MIFPSVKLFAFHALYRGLCPEIRTFICRITEIHFSDPELEEQFKQDIEEMYLMYGLKDGEEA